MKIYVANSFSLCMLDRTSQRGTPLDYTPNMADEVGYVARIPRPVVDPDDLLRMHEEHKVMVVSIIDNASMAKIMSRLLGRHLIADRRYIRLESGDSLLVGQYIGTSLPESFTALPDCARLEWWIL